MSTYNYLVCEDCRDYIQTGINWRVFASENEALTAWLLRHETGGRMPHTLRYVNEHHLPEWAEDKMAGEEE